MSFSDNTFQAAIPVYTYGALVEDFTDDNTFSYSGGTSSIYIQGGTLTEDASWQRLRDGHSGTSSTTTSRVGSGTTLNVQPGVEIYTLRYSYDDYIYDFNVSGTLNVTEAAFVGYTNLIVLDGGTLNLTDTTVSGGNAGHESSWVQFQAGAQGTVTGSTFSIYVVQYSGTKAVPLVSFSDNTFQAAIPVYTYGALVEDFTDDNTFSYSGGTSSIYIQGGTLTEDASWQRLRDGHSGTSSTTTSRVGSGTTLNVQPGVEIYTLRYSYDDYIYDFNVSGTLNVTEAALVGYTNLNVLEGGTLSLIDTTVSGGNAGRDKLLGSVPARAQATVTGCDFSIYVVQYSGTKAAPLVSFSGNTFQASPHPVYTYGALVEDFTDDNTFNYSGGLSSIYIQGGTLTEDASWQRLRDGHAVRHQQPLHAWVRHHAERPAGCRNLHAPLQLR